MASNSSPPGSRKRRRPPRSSENTDEESEPRSKQRRSSNSVADSTCEISSSTDVACGRIGTIEKILVKNFMCHSHLEFSFVPQVNFIIGRNGSGKSAVLTAIMAGLGGKASVTNRGSKISSLIQNGRPSARIEVTLTNTGPEAYKPEIYGRSITVVRTIRTVGGGYEIRAHDRHVVTTKRDELQNILDHMNIQVDNPIVVLNQETSRNFLQSKSAKDKYVFFLKATQLETVKANYDAAEENARQATISYENKSAGLPNLESDVKKYEAILKCIDEIVDSKTKLELLEAELCWSRVIAQEKQVAEATEKFEKAKEHSVQVETKMKSLTENLTVAKDEMKKYTAELAEIDEAKKAKAMELETRKRAMDDAKRKFREGEDEEKKIKRVIKSKEQDKQAVENEIVRAKTNSDEEWKKEKDRRTKEIAVVEEKIASVKSQEAEASQKEASVREDRKSKDSEMRELVDEHRKIKIDCDKILRQIQVLKAAQTNSVNRFGAKTAELLKEIANRRFRVKPKGPIGSFLHLKDDRWAYAVERHCASSLRGFMVDNTEDAKLLKMILDKLNQRNIPVFTRKLGNRRYQCPVATKTPGSQTIFDVLDIKDDDVFNLLVDVSSINQVLLFDDVDAALAKLKRENSVPKNCTIAIDSDYNRVYPAPKYRILSNDRPGQAELLKQAGGDRLPRLDADLKKCREDQAAVEKDLNQVKREVAALETETRKAKDARSALSLEVARCERKLRDLKDFEEPVAVNVSVLEDEVERLSAEIEERKSELPAAKDKLQSLLELVREKVKALKESEAAVKQQDEKVASLRIVLTKCEEKIDKFKNLERNLNFKKTSLEAMMKEREAELKDKKTQCSTVWAGAFEKFPERVETDKRESALKTEIETLQEQIVSMERTQPDPERTRRTFHRLKEKYDSLSSELRELKIYLSELSKGLKQRRETFIKVRDLACFRVNTVFQSLMSSENFAASLVFEHAERKLQIDVKETSQNVRQSQRDVRGLSGGERSFSTVCFICALWSSTDHTPLRVLDEFDIFMDMSKRRKSLQMLLEICQKQARCQFIFLTPLEMPNIDALKGDSVKIQMMPEPERGAIGTR